MVHLYGMTWGHRRAIEPLAALDHAFRKERPDVTIEWRVRPLSGFEFDPLDRLAEENDLIIYDHPFCGLIDETECLLSVADVVSETGGPAAYIGPSTETYRLGKGEWAVPVDAACQVAAYRPDLLAGLKRPVPRTWDDVCNLGEHATKHGMSVAIGLHGVHSLMTFFSLCANLGSPYATDECGPDPATPAAREALTQMRRLVGLCRAPVLDWNSIRIQDALAESDDLVYCPAVYGFAAYGEADCRNRLAFGPFPGLNHAESDAGSTIGGAGLGVSSRVVNDPERCKAALAYARLAAASATQTTIFPRHHGQPAHVDAWSDAGVDAAFNGFFSDTRGTIERSWIRPRYNGYLRFQAEAGDMIEAHLRGDLAEANLLELLKVLDANCRDGGADDDGGL
ncbi:MAG: hypothetical protein RIM72_20380 [Alphaproteobacteria bacterium]